MTSCKFELHSLQESFEIYKSKLAQMDDGRSALEKINDIDHEISHYVIIPISKDPMIPFLSWIYLPQYINQIEKSCFLITSYDFLDNEMLKRAKLEKWITIVQLPMNKIVAIIKYLEVMGETVGICTLDLLESQDNAKLLTHPEISLDDIVACGFYNLAKYELVDKKEEDYAYRLFAGFSE